MVKCHEHRIEDDAQSYEEIDKCVHDEQFNDVSEALPALATLPVKHDLM